MSTTLEKAATLPAGATVTVTASPSHGMEATFDLGEALKARGHDVILHLSAHMMRNRSYLSDLLARARAGGFTRGFVVGGDSKEPGDFHDGLSLLRAMEEIGHPFTDIGVPGYPEGHVDIAPDTLLAALKAKQPYAKYMATQMCFNPGAITDWIGRMRAEGVLLPIHLGTPGPAEITKLMTISARIGVADSARYLKKNRSMIGSILRGRFGPDGLLRAMTPAIADPACDIQALHLFTFNQVEATVEWQGRMLAELSA
jgi:methylenetetrahydrofolate reductase (NADPH)